METATRRQGNNASPECPELLSLRNHSLSRTDRRMNSRARGGSPVASSDSFPPKNCRPGPTSLYPAVAQREALETGECLQFLDVRENGASEAEGLDISEILQTNEPARIERRRIAEVERDKIRQRPERLEIGSGAALQVQVSQT